MHFSELAEIVRREAGDRLGARILDALCKEAKGEQVYIPGRARKPVILPTDTPKDIERRYNVSKSTARNWVNAWRQ